MNRNIMIYIAMLSLMLLSSTAYAEPVMRLMYTLYKNDTLSVNSIEVYNGTIYLIEGAGEYIVRILDAENRTIDAYKVPASFYVFDFGETDYSGVYQRLPWENNTRYLKFHHFNETIATIDVSEYLCNENNMCEPNKGESEFICPQDCISKQAHAVPLPVIERSPAEAGKKGFNDYFYAIAGFAALIIVLLLSVRLFVKKS